MIKISIVVPVFNMINSVKDTLDSILNKNIKT
jgi:glycosyltransferase involved in cell wall biosynthesis